MKVLVNMRRCILLLGAALIFCAWVWRIDPHPLPPTPGTVASPMLIVTRDVQEANSHLPHTISLNGRRIGQLRPGGVMKVPVPVGNHLIALACGRSLESESGRDTPITFKAGETLSFRNRTIWWRACVLSFEKRLEG